MRVFRSGSRALAIVQSTRSVPPPAAANHEISMGRVGHSAPQAAPPRASTRVSAMSQIVRRLVPTSYEGFSACYPQGQPCVMYSVAPASAAYPLYRWLLPRWAFQRLAEDSADGEGFFPGKAGEGGRWRGRADGCRLGRQPCLSGARKDVASRGMITPYTWAWKGGGRLDSTFQMASALELYGHLLAKSRGFAARAAIPDWNRSGAKSRRRRDLFHDRVGDPLRRVPAPNSNGRMRPPANPARLPPPGGEHHPGRLPCRPDRQATRASWPPTGTWQSGWRLPSPRCQARCRAPAERARGDPLPRRRAPLPIPPTIPPARSDRMSRTCSP